MTAAGGTTAIRIGVSGHRFLAETERLAAGVDRALDRIERSFPKRPLLAISSLAEGADRLAARRVLARPGGQLIVPLPLPAKDYSDDFDSDESRAEFRHLLAAAINVIELPAAGARRASYEAASRYVLDHCDVLLAVWDGQGAQGQGGTGEVVAEARARGLPLAWVHAGNRRPGTSEPTSLGQMQGRVSFELFPDTG